jgi:two-component system nitrate/nitrite response regulator NarL
LLARILIVDDHVLFAETIRATLRETGHHVVALATSGAEALEAVEAQRPDVVLLDLGLPDRPGLDVGVAILERHPRMRLLAVTASTDPRTATQALRRGFYGFLTKDASVERFMRAIDLVLDGQVVMPQGLAGLGPQSPDDDLDAVNLRARHLTPREYEVLSLMVAGLDGRGIARALSISRNTVRTHAQSILTKLQVHSRLEAATFAVRHGIVASPGSTSRSA